MNGKENILRSLLVLRSFNGGGGEGGYRASENETRHFDTPLLAAVGSFI